jgi:hypothetical protein
MNTFVPSVSALQYNRDCGVIVEMRPTTATVTSDFKKIVEKDCGLQTSSFPVLSNFIVGNDHSTASWNFNIISFAVVVNTKCLYKSFR